ncbi:MAG: heavy metal translocating P-type ATPase [Pseudomonadota bacterium]
MSSDSQQHCFHCGEPVPEGIHLSVEIDDVEQPMCCPGCQAVASLITGSGLEAFYRLRTIPNVTPAPPTPGNVYLAFDDPDTSASFVTSLPDGWQQAQLLLGGISCAACTWLIEQDLARQPGLRQPNVNLARQTLSVEFDPAVTKTSAVFQRLLTLGYDPHPWQSQKAVELLEAEQRGALRQLAVAGLAMMQVGMFGIALHAGDIQGIAPEYRSLMRWVSLAIATIVVLYSARSFFRNAWINLRHGRLVMDLPVALAIGLAYLASGWATWNNTGEVYFDSIAMFTFFLLLGRFLERQVRRREYLRQTDLQSLLPVSCLKRVQHRWESIATRQIQNGDILLVRAGEVIPADATVNEGTGAVDEAAFTGEQMPRRVHVNDTVSAGTVLSEGRLEVHVQAGPDNSRLSVMLDLLSRASEQKPGLARLADRVAAWFVGILLCVAALVAAFWSQLDAERAFWITLSVLVVSCPCALALATPTALTAASGWLRRRGLLLTGENTLENLNSISHVVFDKTGTLTQGQFRIRATRADDEVGALGLAAALEQNSQHPIAQAFTGVAPTPGVTGAEVIPGAGIRGLYAGKQLAIGTPTLVREIYSELGDAPDQDAHWVALADEDKPLAWFALEDSLRSDAAAVVQSLQARGLQVELLTGDRSSAGLTLATELGLNDVTTGASPEQKLAHIADLQRRGARVTMVGDGLNDAPVLAAADCAIAVNQATDLAKSSADGILLANSLRPITSAFIVAQRCRQIIWQNIAWALAYNSCAVPMAAAGWVPPWAAAIGMSASSLLVVVNSLRLK